MKESFDVIPSAAGLFLQEPLTSKAFLRVESSFNKKDSNKVKESFDVIPSAAGLFLQEPLASKAFLRVESSFNKKKTPTK